MTLLALLGVLLLLIWVTRLRRRVEVLERRVAELGHPGRIAPQPAEGVPAGLVDTPQPVVAAEPPVADPWPRPALAAADTVRADIGEPPVAPVSAGFGASPREAAVVFRGERLDRLFAWLRENWVYAVSALSLALAGIFFVQYGIERGLLSPRLRVISAILFGLALIGAGEYLRRRWGDDEASPAAFLPSTFSGAGIVSVFGGVLAARQLYDLIGSGVAFGGLAATAFVAVLLGWFHGPFLAAIGLIGAGAAPIVLGETGSDPSALYAYFGLLALTGLAIDAARRWAWISVLALLLAFGLSWMLKLAGSGDAHWFALLLAVLPLMAMTIPVLRLRPDHDGPTLFEVGLARATVDRARWFPVSLAAGTMAAASLSLAVLRADTPASSLVIFGCLAALVVAVALWADRAPALADLALYPAMAFLARLFLEVATFGPLASQFLAGKADLRGPEDAAPTTATVLLVMAVLGTGAAAWRSLKRDDHKPFWAAGAALFAPVSVLLLDVFWNAGHVLGPYPWALQVIALAALMAGLAGWFGKADGGDRRRAAYAALSCLSLVALALFLVLTEAALTVALGVLVGAAAWLDRRFRLPEMGWFLQVGVAVLGYRLVLDPGLAFGFDAPFPEVVLAFGGAIAAMGAARWMIGGLGRRGAEVFLETGLAAAAAVFANLMIIRGIDRWADLPDALAHWWFGLNAMPWLVAALVQLHRLQLGGWMNTVRAVLAALFGLIAAGGLALAAIPANPVLAGFGRGPSSLVYGPYLLDTLLLAYAAPAVLIILAAYRMRHLPVWLRTGLFGAGAALLALYIALEIRRFWRGDALWVSGTTQAELYSYTLAMMLAGAGLLYQAIATRSAGLRRIAMGVIALTIAKVFLVDASGLSGLTRVFSFLALGLALAGLAWLNRWAARQGGDSGTLPPAAPSV